MPIPVHAFDLIIARRVPPRVHRGGGLAVARDARSLRRHQGRPHGHACRAHVGLFDRRRAGVQPENGHPRQLPRRLRPVPVASGVRMNGVFLREGEQVRWSTRRPARAHRHARGRAPVRYRRHRAAHHRPQLQPEDRPGGKKYATAHEQRYGRFPKTLSSRPTTSPRFPRRPKLGHALSQRVRPRREVREEDTGSPDVDRPLQRIREFRNRPLRGWR